MLLTERFFFTCVKFLQEAEAFCPQTSKNNKKWEAKTCVGGKHNAELQSKCTKKLGGELRSLSWVLVANLEWSKMEM